MFSSRLVQRRRGSYAFHGHLQSHSYTCWYFHTKKHVFLCLFYSVFVQYLAVLQEGSNAVPIFKMSTRKLTNVDTNFEDLTFLKWSKTGYELAVGTSKGNLLIYKASAKKKIPIMGKHTRVCVDRIPNMNITVAPNFPQHKTPPPDCHVLGTHKT